MSRFRRDCIRTALVFVGGVALSTVALPAQTPTAPDSPTGVDVFGEAVRRASEIDPVNSLLVSQHGRLVVEEYFRGLSANRRVNVKSISKSLISPLIGIAIRDGLIDSVNTPLPELLPEYFRNGEHSAWNTVTLHHILSMTTGMRGTSFGGYGRWVASDDWVANALERPVVCQPGQCWEYSTGNSHIAGVVLAHAAGADLRTYATTALYGPLGIDFRPWDRDPQGNFLGGNNMTMRPRDLITFGELYLNRGQYRGEQLVPEEWIRRSWDVYSVSPWNGHGHGYFWWYRQIDGEPVHFAWGYGGQYVLVIPDLDAVVSITSSLRRAVPRGHNRRVFQFFRRHVLPALRSADSTTTRR